MEEKPPETKTTFSKDELEAITNDISAAESKLKPAEKEPADDKAALKAEIMAEIKKEQEAAKQAQLAEQEQLQQQEALQTIDDLKGKINQMTESKAVVDNKSPFDDVKALENMSEADYRKIDEASKRVALEYFRGN